MTVLVNSRPWLSIRALHVPVVSKGYKKLFRSLGTIKELLIKFTEYVLRMECIACILAH